MYSTRALLKCLNMSIYIRLKRSYVIHSYVYNWRRPILFHIKKYFVASKVQRGIKIVHLIKSVPLETREIDEYMDMHEVNYGRMLGKKACWETRHKHKWYNCNTITDRKSTTAYVAYKLWKNCDCLPMQQYVNAKGVDFPWRFIPTLGFPVYHPSQVVNSVIWTL